MNRISSTIIETTHFIRLAALADLGYTTDISQIYIQTYRLYWRLKSKKHGCVVIDSVVCTALIISVGCRGFSVRYLCQLRVNSELLYIQSLIYREINNHMTKAGLNALPLSIIAILSQNVVSILPRLVDQHWYMPIYII